MFDRSKKLELFLKKLGRLSFVLPKLKIASNTEALYIKSSHVFKRASALSLAVLVATSFSANGYSEGYLAAEYVENTMPMQGIVIADSDGYLTKISPQTGASDRTQMTDKVSHSVAAGETLSGIAEKYGVSTQTILWENNISNKNALRTGQVLSIPPVDGVTHTVKSGENLEKVAQLYEVEVDLITKQNKLASTTISKGQELIIPGGEKIVPAVPKVIAQAPREAVPRTASTTRAAVPAADLPSTDAQPAAGKSFIFPTRGIITQYFHRGHYAYDIADASRPPVWAAGAGTVEKVSVGSWGGGYGNHLIIDHGNGYKTLYAHLGSVSVAKGQYVNQGQALGQMGNTGRVYGRTGIHLHFEVRHNGVKQNPGNFF